MIKQNVLKKFLLLFLTSIFIVNCDFALDDELDDYTSRANNPLKVFILAGQSNMEGKGVVEPKQSQLDKNGGKGTLRYLYDKNKSQYKYLVDSSGKWSARNDVWLVDVSKQGPLKADFSGNSMGPELQFGHELGNHYKNNQVLLIKTAWGGKSLYVNFRPPSSGGKTGDCYNDMIKRVKEVLGNIKKFYPAYNGQGYELVGFGWHQGWNDRVKDEAVDEYLENCVNLVNDLRKEFKINNFPFVIANTGMGEDVSGKALKLMEDQLKVPKDSKLNVKSNVGAVDTRPFYIKSDDSPNGFTFHWNCNAKSYLDIGGAMGKKMISIVGNGGNDGNGNDDENNDGNDNDGGDKYKLRVRKGSGSGTYSVNEVVKIIAKNPSKFKKWKVVSGNPKIKQIKSSNTTLTMPSRNVEIKAIYSTKSRQDDLGCGSIFDQKGNEEEYEDEDEDELEDEDVYE